MLPKIVWDGLLPELCANYLFRENNHDLSTERQTVRRQAVFVRFDFQSQGVYPFAVLSETKLSRLIPSTESALRFVRRHPHRRRIEDPSLHFSKSENMSDNEFKELISELKSISKMLQALYSSLKKILIITDLGERRETIYHRHSKENQVKPRWIPDKNRKIFRIPKPEVKSDFSKSLRPCQKPRIFRFFPE